GRSPDYQGCPAAHRLPPAAPRDLDLLRHVRRAPRRMRAGADETPDPGSDHLKGHGIVPGVPGGSTWPSHYGGKPGARNHALARALALLASWRLKRVPSA